MDHTAFERLSDLLREAGFTITHAQYDHLAFGGWFIDVSGESGRLRFVYDAKDRWVTLQRAPGKSGLPSKDWEDLWIGRGREDRRPEILVARALNPSAQRLLCWDLWRQDDNGHRAVVATFYSRAAAEQALGEFEQLKHKQTYWLEEHGAP